MFVFGIASGVEHTFVAKGVQECNFEMGHVVRVGRRTHIYMMTTLVRVMGAN
jgi:hypothetical protein